MTQLNNPMDILKLLENSNCRECGEASCMAFAAAVYRGERRLEECTRLGQETLNRYGQETKPRVSIEQDMEAVVQELKEKVTQVDLAEAAERVGGRYAGGWLTISVLGKDFKLNQKGRIAADIHVNPWVTIPVLNYVLQSKGVSVSGSWISFRELPSGRSWYPLFAQRCEKPMKEVADSYTNLFTDMLDIFNGKQIESQFASDISIVLHPLPKLPLLVCYWKPEDELESSLHLFFDTTAEDNLPIESIHALGSGLAQMFEKIARRHGGD